MANCAQCRRKVGFLESLYGDEGVCSECNDRAKQQRADEQEAAVDARTAAMNSMKVTTGLEIFGHTVIGELGIVRGIVVRSRSIIGSAGAALQTIVGGDITLLSELCEQTRGAAFDAMRNHAIELGANGIVGFRYDATEVVQGVTEVLAYGTAVIVRPNAQHTA